MKLGQICLALAFSFFLAVYLYAGCAGVVTTSRFHTWDTGCAPDHMVYKEDTVKVVTGWFFQCRATCRKNAGRLAGFPNADQRARR